MSIHSDPKIHALITTRDGLLIRNGEVIQLPEADRVAKDNGYSCAERYVKALEQKQTQRKKTK